MTRGHSFRDFVMLEDLKRTRVRDIHEAKFLKISGWINRYYSDYVNSKKIIILFDYWLYASRSFIECYGIEEFQKFIDSGTKCFFRFSWISDFGEDITVKEIRSYGNIIIYSVLSLFCKHPLIAGSDVHSIVSKIVVRVTTLMVRFLPLTHTQQRQVEFVEIVMEYFDDNEQFKNIKGLDNFIPKLFYSNYIRTIINRSLVIEGAPTVFLEFTGYERMLLNNTPIRIIGRQHGGGYSAYRTSYLDEYENKLSDVYIGWGLSSVNKHQHKFSKRNVVSKPISNIRRIIWVERGRMPKFYLSIWHEYDYGPIKYIAKELSQSGIKYCNIPYPSFGKSTLYQGVRGHVENHDRRKAEEIIGNNDIVIFDTCTATLIHYCIENDIIYIVVISKKAADALTLKQKEWFNVMRESGLAYYDDETNCLAKRIIEVTDSNFVIPERILEYHYNIFINI